MLTRFVVVLATVPMLAMPISACHDTTEGIRTEFVGSYAFSATERRTIARIAGLTTLEARQHLPALAPQLILQVRSGTDVIPEVGAGAVVAGREFVRWTVDTGRPEGVVAIAERHLRATLLHEFHHLVRADVPGHTLIDRVIGEGLATAFERDVAGVSPPWGQYPDDVETWVQELLAQPASANPQEWLFRHPDGRRWVGMRAGTYLADRAMKALHRTAAELATTPTAEILAVASNQ
jgi:hypothetical protein